MNRRTILSHQFSKSGFHRYTASELHAKDANDNNEPLYKQFASKLANEKSSEAALVDCKSTPDAFIHLNFLPCFKIKNNVFSTHLWCVEASPTGTGIALDRYKFLVDGQGGSKGATLVLEFQLENENPASGYSPVSEDQLHPLINDDVDRKFSANLYIILDKEHFCVQGSMLNNEMDDRLCERKFWYALELTSGYRYLAEICGRLLNGRPIQKITPNKHPLHSTEEGAQRLVCSFDSIEAAVFDPNTPFGQVVNIKTTATKFLELREIHKSAYQSYLDYWRIEKRVSTEIVEKKTLEFFIRQTIGLEE